MFTRSKLYTSVGQKDPTRYIEVKNSIPDVSNSQLLYLLDRETEKLQYTINKFAGRIDLISSDIYGTKDFEWILLYLNRITPQDLVIGKKIEYIPLNKLNKLLTSV